MQGVCQSHISKHGPNKHLQHPFPAHSPRRAQGSLASRQSISSM
jgi:hypothetical protein